MKKIILFLALIVLFIFSAPSVFADASDDFNSGFSSWTSDGIAQKEDFLCGSGCSSVKLSNTTRPNPNGRLVKTFPVILGAKYQVTVKAGVYTGGDSPHGSVTLTANAGGNNYVNYCFNDGTNPCTALGSNINGSLSLVNILAEKDTLTVYLDGTQGGCIDGGGCHDPYVDDFSLTKTADPVVVANDSATCGSVTVNSGNTIYTGQVYSATVTMNNNGNTTWVNSGTFPYKLGAQDPQVDSGTTATWGNTAGGDSGKGARPVRINSPSTSPSNSADFTFDVTTPDTNGNYRLAYQMLKEGEKWIDNKCAATITVSAAAGEAANPSVTCSVNKTTAVTGENVTWAAKATDGTGTGYTYSWSGSTDSLDSMTAHPATLSYATAGTKNGKVQVTDSAGNPSPITDCSNSVTITEPPPTVDLKVNGSDGPVTGLANNLPVNLSWTTTNNPTSCTASSTSNIWSGPKTNSGGNETSTALTGPANYTFTLFCLKTGVTQQGTDSVAVSVNGSGGSTPSCTPESNAAFCLRLAKNCDSVTGTDNCGASRTVSCGSCTSPLTCGGGGTANFCGSSGGGGGSGGSGSSAPCPWIQTTGGDVHTNTRIVVGNCGP